MLENGLMIAGRYEIVGNIGTGGMADVYKAKDHTLARMVAVKVLKSEFATNAEFVTKFHTEALAAAGLEHPNIVNIYDVGSENGTYYIVMELVEGITLKYYIEKKQKLNYKETLSVAIMVARGIQAAHAKNIIHRDIKPQNIIISRDGKVKVTDFGIAKAVSEQTIHSDVMGSVHYASPEQARNGYVSMRSDIYSLGIVMYEMITGRVPFDGASSVEVAIKHLQDEIVAPSAIVPDIPVSLEKIILKCTQKNADRRYESIDALLIDLRKALVSPDEDFVVIAPVGQGKTRVITEAEVREIQEKTAAKAVEVDTYKETKTSSKPVRRVVEETLPEDPDDDEFDDDDDDGFVNSKMEKIINILRIVVAALIVIIVLYMVLSFLGIIKFSFPGSKKDDKPAIEVQTFEMIKLTDYTYDEAKKILEDHGIYIEVSETINPIENPDYAEFKEGQIVEQSVPEGEVVKEGDTVKVVIVSSETEEEQEAEEDVEPVEVPNVVNQKLEDAQKELEAKGFKVTREFEVSSSVTEGTVIRQDPAGSTKLAPGSTITIFVSQGNEAVPVPDVLNKSQADAEALIKNAKLNVGNVSTAFSDTVAKGAVISQSLEANKKVEAGTKVDIVISDGPETHTYWTKTTINAPTKDGDGNEIVVDSADIELFYAESDELITAAENVTSFPYILEKHDLANGNGGSVVITWHYHYPDKPDESISSEQTASIGFHEE